MKIDGENLESLLKLVRKLEKENKILKAKLDKANIPYETNDLLNDETNSLQETDIDQGERIISSRYIDDELARSFIRMFWGRDDVFAKRGKNGGYFLQCDNRWKDICPKQHGEKIKCLDCVNKKWSRLALRKIVEHLIGDKEDGSDVIGVYPLLKDMTCRFMVFDFDSHDDCDNGDWKSEISTLRLICNKNNISHLVERSRSGNGGHLWIFFKEPISASLVRNFGYLLLEKGQTEFNLKSFKYYDRMYPCQDYSDGVGNLIALPLQGQALKNGNSAFVDENFNAYSDQWDTLFKTEKLSLKDVEKYIQEWMIEVSGTTSLLPNYEIDRVKPWNKDNRFSCFDVVGNLHIVLNDGVYVDTLNLMPRLQNQIRSLAAFDNPIFYKNKNLGYSNYNNPSCVYMGKDVDGYIRIPRGLRELLIEKCKEANIEVDIDDQREKGRPIKFLLRVI